MSAVFHRLPFTLSLVCMGILSAPVMAEEDDFDLMGEISLQDLFVIDTDIASNTSRPVNEQPSIISVISREQILNSGARDLIDILRSVPGFGFAHDTVGINSWGFRGIWGHEGKIMLMIDGAPYNDAAWGNVQLGRHYPVELIEKIEIIRGPGAAKFGNYAELAVVRITTIGEDMQGGYVDTNVRSMDDIFGSGEITAMYGNKTESGIGYSTSLHVKNANKTNLPFKNGDGSISTSQENAPIHVVSWDGKVSYKGLKLSSVLEQYNFEHQESFLQLPQPALTMDNGYDRFHLGADYSKEINDSWTVNTSVLYQETMVHDMVVVESRDNDLLIGSHYRIDTERTIYSADLMYTISDNDSLNFGVEYFDVDAKSRAIGEYFNDPGHNIEGDSTELSDKWFENNTSDTFNLDQKSAFVQYENYNDVVNFTLGVRFADHSKSAEKVTVPRIGLSRSWGDFGVKAMYSEAFRTGDVEHVNLFKDKATRLLAPEKLDSTEIEFHYLHETGMYSINFFSMNIEDPIVFNTDSVTENMEEIVSKGFEAAWKNKSDGFEQEINISYYKGGENSAPPQLAQDEKSYLGFPQLKAVWMMDYEVSEKTNFNASAMYEGKKWWRKVQGDPSQDVELDAVFKLNVAVTHTFNDNFEMQFAIHDLLDEGYYFPQAYGQVNYPGDAREFSLSFQYRF